MKVSIIGGGGLVGSMTAFALQTAGIDSRQFAEICSAWALRKQTPLADLRVERGWLTPEDRNEVDRAVARHLNRHGGDARASLQAVADSRVRQSLAGVPDASRMLGEDSSRSAAFTFSTEALFTASISGGSPNKGMAAEAGRAASAANASDRQRPAATRLTVRIMTVSCSQTWRGADANRPDGRNEQGAPGFPGFGRSQRKPVLSPAVLERQPAD